MKARLISQAERGIIAGSIASVSISNEYRDLCHESLTRIVGRMSAKVQ